MEEEKIKIFTEYALNALGNWSDEGFEEGYSSHSKVTGFTPGFEENSAKHLEGLKNYGGNHPDLHKSFSEQGLSVPTLIETEWISPTIEDLASRVAENYQSLRDTVQELEPDKLVVVNYEIVNGTPDITGNGLMTGGDVNPTTFRPLTEEEFGSFSKTLYSILHE